MREIKFRAWHKKEKEMWYPSGKALIHWDGIGIEYGDGYSLKKGGLVIDEGIILMQYTGLKDRNGVEIYEGDLLNIEDSIKWNKTYEITFSDGAFCCEDRLNILLGICNHEKGEVIGNIYENSELLKEV